jgi:hypothetical protein
VESPIGLKSLSLGWYEAVYILGIATAIKLEQNQCYAAQVPTRLVWVSVWYCLRSYQSHRILSTTIDIPLLTPGGAGLHARPQATYQTLVGCSNSQIRKVTIRSVERNELMAHGNT